MSDQLAASANWGQALGHIVEELFPPFFFPVWTTLLLVLLLVVCRSKRIASVVFVLGLSLLFHSGGNFGGEDLPFAISFAFVLLFWVLNWFFLTRFGLLFLMIMILFGGWGSFAMASR